MNSPPATPRTPGRAMKRVIASGFNSFRVADFTTKKKSQGSEKYVLKTMILGDKKKLYKHLSGHVLASTKFIKAIPIEKKLLHMWDCTIVSESFEAEYTISLCKALSLQELTSIQLMRQESKASTRKAQRRSTGYFSETGSVTSKYSKNSTKVMANTLRNAGRPTKLKEKGSGTIAINNSLLTVLPLGKQKKKASRNDSSKSGSKNFSRSSLMRSSVGSSQFLDEESSGHLRKVFNWAQLYAIESEPSSSEFTVIFYAPIDEEIEANFAKGHFSSDMFQFISVKLKCKDEKIASTFISKIYLALHSQALMATKTAETLGLGTNKRDTEDVLRLSVDLWTLQGGLVSGDTVDAQKHLVQFLEGKTIGDPGIEDEEDQQENDKEVEYWTNLIKCSEEMLVAMTESRDAVGGVCL